MTRPDVSCLCVAAGIHAAVSAEGPTRERMLAAFRAAHSGPGHVPEQPARSWYGREAKLVRLLRRLQAEAGS